MIPYTDVKQAQDAYPPGRFEKFIFRYFSKDTKEKDAWLNKLLVYIGMAVFTWGAVLTILQKNAKVPTLIFTGYIICISIPRFVCLFIHNHRIRQIARALGLTLRQYNRLYV